jgi:hypothetical protein
VCAATAASDDPVCIAVDDRSNVDFRQIASEMVNRLHALQRAGWRGSGGDVPAS